MLVVIFFLQGLPAFAGSDARLVPFTSDDRGAGASRSSIVWADGSWVRYVADSRGILRQDSPDGLSWSAPSVALEGDVAEPSVISVETGEWSWLMAYSSGGQVDIAGSVDGRSFSVIPEDHPPCSGECGAPTLLHVGRYYILNHTEHTSGFDGMRVHHSEDALTWSSGITHTLPDGADNPDILYAPDGSGVQWRLVSKDPEADIVHVWQSEQIEGDKTEIGVYAGVGAPSFYRSASGAALGASPWSFWLTDGERVVRTALLDGEVDEVPPDAACDAVTGGLPGAVAGPRDGPATDGAMEWSLPEGGAVCEVTFALAPGADFTAVTGLDVEWEGPDDLEVELIPADGSGGVALGTQSASGSFPVSGVGELQGILVRVHVSTAVTFRLSLLTATGLGSWPGLDEDSGPEDSGPEDSGRADTDTGAPPLRDCGCAAGGVDQPAGLRPTGLGAGGLGAGATGVALALARRRRPSGTSPASAAAPPLPSPLAPPQPPFPGSPSSESGFSPSGSRLRLVSVGRANTTTSRLESSVSAQSG